MTTTEDGYGEPARWVSPETEAKERDFRDIVQIHVRIVSGIKTRWPSPRYFYVDCHAGRGNLSYGGRSFPGSPLIWLDEAARTGIGYEAWFFENDPDEAELLRPHVRDATLVVGDCRAELANVLRSRPREPYRMGLVYSDPIGEEIPASSCARWPSGSPASRSSAT